MSKIYDALRRAEEENRPDDEGTRAASPGAPPDGLSARHRAVPLAGSPLTPARHAAARPAVALDQIVEQDLGALRTSIDGLLPRGHRRIAFASLGPEEGTSTMVAGFIRLLAADQSLRVAAIDANMLAPRLPALIGGESSPGLADVLTGSVAAEAALVALEGTNVHLLPAGKTNARLLHFDASTVERVFASFAGYDYTVIDCPPLLAWAHSPALASEADGVVLVVRWSRTKREVVQRGLDALRGGGARVLGVVLNRRQYPIPEFLYRRA